MGKARALFAATRPYSFTATLVPVMLGTAVAKALFPAMAVAWGAFALALVGALAIHVVANTLNDFFDARSGLDNPDNYGRFNAVVAGLATPRETLLLALGGAIVAALVGLWFWSAVGTPILVLALLGATLAVAYTLPPVSLKHHALGDVAVLLGFGLGMAFGAYVVQAHGQRGAFDPSRLLAVLAYALPCALPMVGILWANNHRDRLNDRQYGARTLANLLPPALSRRVLEGLLAAPLALLLATSLGGLTSAWVLLAALALPVLLRLLREVRTDRFDGPLVPQIAQYHGLFGLLATLGLVVRSLGS